MDEEFYTYLIGKIGGRLARRIFRNSYAVRHRGDLNQKEIQSFADLQQYVREHPYDEHNEVWPWYWYGIGPKSYQKIIDCLKEEGF